MVELELLIDSFIFVITSVVTVFTSIAYYRTRRNRVLVLVLLSLLLGVQALLEIGEEFLEEGIPFLGLISDLLGLSIALLLFATVVRRFS